MKASGPPSDYGTIPKQQQQQQASASAASTTAAAGAATAAAASSYQNSARPLEIHTGALQEQEGAAGSSANDPPDFRLPSPPPDHPSQQPQQQQPQQQPQQAPPPTTRQPQPGCCAEWGPYWWRVVMGPKASAAHAAIAFLDSCVAAAIFPELPALAGT